MLIGGNMDKLNIKKRLNEVVAAIRKLEIELIKLKILYYCIFYILLYFICAIILCLHIF